MSDSAVVAQFPECDIHRHVKDVPGVEARFDGKTRSGPWAHMCPDCFEQHGVGLGTGRGQRLELGVEPRSDV